MARRRRLLQILVRLPPPDLASSPSIGPPNRQPASAEPLAHPSSALSSSERHLLIGCAVSLPSGPLLAYLELRPQDTAAKPPHRLPSWNPIAEREGNERTIYAWTLENRTSLAGRTESIALNLHDKPTKSEKLPEYTHEYRMPSVSQDTSVSLPCCNSVPCACDMICSSWTLEARCSYGESAIARYRPADETWRLTSW